jgi:hypothetical protein
MEGRRVEGVFLDTAILRNKAYEAYETAKIYEIKILSKVPEALLASLGEPGSRFRATVKSMEGGKVILSLENGYEVEAENRLAMPVKVGEELSLVLESKNPVVLRVERAFSGIRGVQDLIKTLFQSTQPLLKDASVKETVERSGILYERRVWDFLRGALSSEELSSDQKYIVLKALERADTSHIEKALKGVRVPESLEGRISQLVQLLQKGDKVEFFKELTAFRSELEGEISLKESRINLVRDTVREVFRSLIDSFLQKGHTLGLKLTLEERVYTSMAENPRSIDVFKEAIRSLETNHLKEFVQRLGLVGVKVENPEVLPEVKEKLLSLMKDLSKGAVRVLSSTLNTEDIQNLVKEIKELSEEVRSLSELREKLSSELPKSIRENLSRLESINYMQSFFISQEGRKFIVPFGSEEGKGFLAFSLRDSFRIFVRLSFEEGFLGVLMESPKKEKPEYVNLLFKTDIDKLRNEISRSLHLLKRELEDLGLEVRKLEVLEGSVHSFEREVAHELGEEGVFNLRV